MFILWSSIISGVVMTLLALWLNTDHGEYTWVEDDYKGPPPAFALVLRSKDSGWARIEYVWRGHGRWIHWGQEGQ